ncbi:MAG TPA: isochorismatase family protein [Acidimicrobiales bacterium]|nr:isochorismatase family protein [Acidimicrobiales bacterium]
MPVVLSELVDPTTTALVTCELQRGVVGDLAPSPELVEVCRETRLVETAAALCTAARACGARVVHAVVELRGDRAGLSINNPMMAMVTKNPAQVRQGTPAADLVPELGPEPEDIEIRRIHGLTPFTSTSLDQVLRNLGVRTVVPVGVSLNEALLGLCLSAADLGYRIALPTDAVAGHPMEYGRDVLQHTLAYLSNLTTSGAIIEAWRSGESPAPQRSTT